MTGKTPKLTLVDESKPEDCRECEIVGGKITIGPAPPRKVYMVRSSPCDGILAVYSTPEAARTHDMEGLYWLKVETWPLDEPDNIAQVTVEVVARVVGCPFMDRAVEGGPPCNKCPHDSRTYKDLQLRWDGPGPWCKHPANDGPRKFGTRNKEAGE